MTPVFESRGKSRRNAILAAVVAATGIAALLPASPALAQAKEPPACAAITFRPIPPGTGDGEQEAGMYKSRFGRIVVKGVVKGGQVEGYFVTVNNARPAASATLPPSVAACAKSKKLPAPGAAASACTGDGLRVLIDRSPGKRYVLLYARQAGKWQMCSAGVA
jgi:hypothetical protein